MSTTYTSREEILLEYLDALPYEPYPVQERALMSYFDDSEASDGKSGVLVCAPTGTGKTLIAESALFEALKTNSVAYYTTPLIALTEQKFQEIQEAAEKWGFSKDQVGLVTGNRSVNSHAPIKVVVAEILLNRLLHPEAFDFDKTAAVVMDEFHSFADPDRGIVWELTLSLLPTHVRLLLLSATVGNSFEFLNWLKQKHDRDLVLVQSHDRKVPLTYHWIADELLPDQLSEMVKGTEDTRRNPGLVFCFDRARCWSTAEQLTGRDLITPEQKAELIEQTKEVDFSGGAGPTLKRILLRGVGIHHAGLLPKHRRLVESLFQQKLLSYCVCTETLAAGMNLPARSVILTELLKGPKGKKKLIAASQAQQMFGRAGRPQYDTQGHVYAVAHEDDVKILRHKQKIEQIPEDTKDPKLMAMRKKLVKKTPKRREGFQYWSEEQFVKLQEAEPGKLESKGQLPWRLLAFLLAPHSVESDEANEAKGEQRPPITIEELRDVVNKRLMPEPQIQQAQKQLTQMLVTLHQQGFATLTPEPPTPEGQTPEDKASDTEASGKKEAAPEPAGDLLSGLTFGMGSGGGLASPEPPKNKPQETKKEKAKPQATATSKLDEYVPESIQATDNIDKMLKFRAVQPLYGAFLLDYLGEVEQHERIQIFESLLEMPGSVARHVRVPWPEDLPPSEIIKEKVDSVLLQAGLVTHDEMYPPPIYEQKEENAFGDPLKFPMPLGDKMLLLFRNKVRHGGKVPVNPVWAAGDILDYDDFHKFISARELAKQEGVIFRHLLRMILLCDEFSAQTPAGMEEAEWQSELKDLAGRWTEFCRKVDPASTDETLEQFS